MHPLRTMTKMRYTASNTCYIIIYFTVVICMHIRLYDKIYEYEFNQFFFFLSDISNFEWYFYSRVYFILRKTFSYNRIAHLEHGFIRRLRLEYMQETRVSIVLHNLHTSDGRDCVVYGHRPLADSFRTQTPDVPAFVRVTGVFRTPTSAYLHRSQYEKKRCYLP